MFMPASNEGQLPIKRDEAEPPAARGSDADLASDQQIKNLQLQLEELSRLTAFFEQEIAAEEAKNTGDASDELDRARKSVQAMRSAIDQVRGELMACTEQKSGRKRMSASRVATLTNAVSAVIHVAAQEKEALTEARSSAHHAPSVAAPVLAAAKPVAKAVRELTVIVAPPAIPPIHRVVAEPAPAIRIQHQVESLVASARHTINEITDSAPVRTVREFTSSAVNEVSAFVTSIPERASNLVSSVKAKGAEAVDGLKELASEHIGKPIKKAADYVADTSLYKATVKPVVETAKSVYHAAADKLKSGAEWVAAAPGRAKQWVAGLFTSEPEATKIAAASEKKVPANKPALKKAEPAATPSNSSDTFKSILQAASYASPLVLMSQQVNDALSFSAQALPKVHDLFTSLNPLH